jgi:aspartate/methionine/tyrosine aminotransferase
MNNLARRMSRLGSESAFAVLSKAQALEAGGIKVVHLEIGDPDFNTPPNICESAVRAMKSGLTHYCSSQGTILLRKEIAGYLERTRGIPVDPERVVVAPGAKPIIFYSILALLEEGDEAIYPNPGFPTYESMINFSGAKPVPIPLREEIDFRLDVDELRSKITPRTKLIILNSPQNPTRRCPGESDVRALPALALDTASTFFPMKSYDHIFLSGSRSASPRSPGCWIRRY